MKHDQLRKLFAELLAATVDAQRFYKLDDKYAIHVNIRTWRFDILDQLTATLAVYERVVTTDKIQGPSGAVSERVEIDWDAVDYESLPAQLLVRVSEIKYMVERWNASELEELPPSTMQNFIAEDDARWEARRGRRRRLR